MAGPSTLPPMAAILMAGGAGTRFWPASRSTRPKQFLALTSDKTLLEETLDRFTGLVAPNDVFVCATQAQSALLSTYCPQIRGRIFEPEAKNTAPCLMLSTAHLIHLGYSDSTVVLVAPADHYIADSDAFARVAAKAARVATETQSLVTIGITPTHPHTGYGYIERGERWHADNGVFQVARFVEKPNATTALHFLKSGNFSWNSGIFLWTLGTIRKAFETHTPTDWHRLLAAKTPDEVGKAYAEVKAEAIDVAVLEKASPLYMVQGDFPWSDVGSWNALHALHAKSPEENVFLSPATFSHKSKGCLVQTTSLKRVALVGAENLVVVEHEGDLLIAHRNLDQEIKTLVNELNSAEDIGLHGGTGK